LFCRPEKYMFDTRITSSRVARSEAGMSRYQTSSGLPKASRFLAPLGPAVPRPERPITASISEICRPCSAMRRPMITSSPFSFTTPMKPAWSVRGSRK